MAFIQTSYPLPPAGVTGSKLYSIEPKNWRRYPAAPQTADMLAPAGVPDILSPTYDAMTDWSGGDVSDDPVVSSATATEDYAPKRHVEFAVIWGVDIAVDTGKSYNDDLPGGDVEPFAAYPVEDGKPTSDDIPDAFKPAALVVPAPPEPEP